MVLAEGTTNLMQRLARLPTAPYLGPLLRREPVPSSLPHQHHLGKEMISIRWCCIDRLSWHWFSETSVIHSKLTRYPILFVLDTSSLKAAILILEYTNELRHSPATVRPASPGSFN